MNTSLPARTRVLRARLVALDNMGANVEEAGLLEDLRSDLATPSAKLSRALVQRRLLIDNGIPVAGPASLDAARKRAAGLLEKFKEEKKAATLKRGVGWTHLVRDIEAASTDVSTVVVTGWKAYREELFTGDAPATVRGRIAFTPANATAFKRYEQLHQSFRQEFDRLPADRAAIDRVRSLAKELTETAKALDYDVPTEVKRFLEAVQSGGAALGLLTETVKAWLSANDAFGSYRIVSRGIDGGR